MKPVVFHRAARAELDDAMSFYEHRATGLGLDFQVKVKEAIIRIQQHPAAWPRHQRSSLRKSFTERFPFTIFYLELPDCLWIAAIAHGSRRPGYWRDRRPETEI